MKVEVTEYIGIEGHRRILKVEVNDDCMVKYNELHNLRIKVFREKSSRKTDSVWHILAAPTHRVDSTCTARTKVLIRSGLEKLIKRFDVQQMRDMNKQCGDQNE